MLIRSSNLDPELGQEFTKNCQNYGICLPVVLVTGSHTAVDTIVQTAINVLVLYDQIELRQAVHQVLVTGHWKEWGGSNKLVEEIN